jgi:hypothetical protein
MVRLITKLPLSSPAEPPDCPEAQFAPSLDIILELPNDYTSYLAEQKDAFVTVLNSPRFVNAHGGVRLVIIFKRAHFFDRLSMPLVLEDFKSLNDQGRLTIRIDS